MIKRFVVLFIVCLFLFPYFSYAEMPAPDPGKLWNYITKKSSYKKWGFWPDHKGLQKGRAPHGPLHKVYVNLFGLSSAKPPVKYGTIAVKENFNKNRELKVITVMYKVKGYNPDGGDWFWVKYSPEGRADKYGKPNGCLGCHGVRYDNDFILVHEFK